MKARKYFAVLALVAALLAVFAFAACGPSAPQGDTGNPPQAGDPSGDQTGGDPSADEGKVVTENGITYVCVQGGTGYEVTAVADAAGAALTLPSAVDGKPVVGIGEDAFPYGGQWESVLFPETLTYIRHNDTLRGLADAEYGGGVYIGTQTNPYFALVGVGAVSAGDSLTLHEDTAVVMAFFLGNSNLKAIEVPAANAAYKSDDGVLYSKDGKLLVAYPADKSGVVFTVPDGVERFKDHALYRSRFASVTLPETLADIGAYAFSNNTSLGTVSLPATVTSVGERAYFGCSSLRSVEFCGTVAQWEAVNCGADAFASCLVEAVVCTDGTVPIGQTET